MSAVAWLIAIPLSLFGLRRYCLLVASLLPWKPPKERADLTVSILIAARNEERTLPRLLAALDGLEYPSALLHAVIVSDGSEDGTAAIAGRWIAGKARAQLIVLPTSHGKANSLQTAFDNAPESTAIVVLDADVVPEPRALATLLGALNDSRVGAACGYPDPGADQQTIVGRYAAVERWVSHLVTLAGKDRLALQPSVIGAFFCVRREALVEAGGFTSRSIAEDIDLSQRLNALGWKTRWIGDARVTEHVPEVLSAFIAQRTRWARGLLATGRSIRTLEDAFVAAGYLDRILVLAAIAATVAGIMPWFVLAIYALGPVTMIIVALQRAQPTSKWSFWWAIAVMATVDIYLSIVSLIDHSRNAATEWSGRQT